MKLPDNEKIRKIAIILIGVLLTVILYQLLWKPSSSTPFGNFAILGKENRELADGIWGQLGFYASAKDNIVTFILIGLIIVSIIYRFIFKPYNRFVNKPPARKKTKTK